MAGGICVSFAWSRGIRIRGLPPRGSSPRSARRSPAGRCTRATSGDRRAWLVGRRDRLLTHPFPGEPVLAGGVPDPRLPLGLAGVPHLVLTAVLAHHRTVDVVFPTGGSVRAEDDGRRSPEQAVLALD